MINSFIELKQSLEICPSDGENTNVLAINDCSDTWVIDLDLHKNINYVLNLTCINFKNYAKKIVININLLDANINAEINMNCLALDTSQTEIILNGNGLVKNSQGTLKLHINGIIDSPEARITGKPNFFFKTNNVNATHGLVIGNLNPIELNYLLSRGIDPKQAKFLLVSSKLFKVLNDLDDNIKNQYQNQIIKIWEGNHHA